MERKLTTANVLTIIRIFLVPIFIVFYLDQSFYLDGFPLYAILVFLLAFFTDILDGVIARSKNQVTNLGKVLDPLADKLLRLGVMCSFAVTRVLPLWMFIVLLFFDIVMIVASSILYFHKIYVKSNWVGKATTVYLSFALFSCFFHNSIAPVDTILVGIGIVLAVGAIVQYVIKFFKIYKKVK
ncbi:MAG: CDP-alcohol phosphatidyltransferase family protein [Christensenellales bacterium]